MDGVDVSGGEGRKGEGWMAVWGASLRREVPGKSVGGTAWVGGGLRGG